jgi:hypothetical protein
LGDIGGGCPTGYRKNWHRISKKWKTDNVTRTGDAFPPQFETHSLAAWHRYNIAKTKTALWGMKVSAKTALTYRMARTSAFFGLLLITSGCAPAVWNKPGATSQDFATDKYACERDARQSGGFGTGIAGAIEVQEFFNRCLVAHGWEAQGTTPSPRQVAIQNNNQALTVAKETLTQCRGKLLEEAQYASIAPYLPNNNTGEFTVKQLAEEKKISAVQKTAYENYLDENLSCSNQYVSAVRSINSKAADLLQQLIQEANAIKASALRGDISWGEMNSRLQQLDLQFKDKLSAVK